jgi:predicted  nucleic acid-binding Zn-ribbon protein
MAEMRCPNCGRKLERRPAAGKIVRCPKCGENLRHLARNEPNQGWEKLTKLLEGSGLSPLGSSPAALSATLHTQAAVVSPPTEKTGQADASVEPLPNTEDAGSGAASPEVSSADAILLEVRAIGDEVRGAKEGLGQIEARLAALEALLSKR